MKILVFVVMLVFMPPSYGQQPDNSTGAKHQSSISKTDVEEMIDKSFNLRIKPIVQNEVIAQEERRFKQLSWLLAIISIVGLGTFGAVTNNIIDKTVEKRLEKRTGNISSALEFSKYYLLALKLELGDAFTKKDVDAIMNYLRKIEDNSEIRYSPEFVSALFQVMKSFTSAGQSASIDELFIRYEKEILSEPTLVQPLLHHYGQEIIGRNITPTVDVGYRAFEKLERVAGSSSVPELALSYRVLYESKKGTPEANGVVQKLIESSTKLAEEDRARFLHVIFLRSVASNWMHRVTRQGHAIEVCVREFINKQKDTLQRVYGLPIEKSEDIVANGISTQESELLATQLSKVIT